GLYMRPELTARDIPIRLVKDPSYHLLYEFARHVRAGRMYKAEGTLIDAFNRMLSRVPGAANRLEEVSDIVGFLDRMATGDSVPHHLALHLRKAFDVLDQLPEGIDMPDQMQEAIEWKNLLLPPLSQLRLPYNNKRDLIR